MNFKRYLIGSLLISMSLFPEIGVDDNQVAIFEIMDGDLMTCSSFGYIFATLNIPVGKLFAGNSFTTKEDNIHSAVMN